MSDTSYDALIIGAGHNGLVCGAYLARSGMKVLVLERRPDVILMDINLPGMDGYDALRQLRDDLHLPVIMLTARRRELDEVLGLELGADDYVTKPFSVKELMARVRSICDA